MFLFWIFRSKHVARTPCCLCNISCHAKPLMLLFIILQISLLLVIVLHLRGVVDLLSPWDLYLSAPSPEKYKNYLIVKENEIFKMQDSSTEYFKTSGSRVCLIAGTKSYGLTKCNCHKNWHGDECGIPDAIWYNSKKLKLTKRVKPRRLLYAFSVNNTIDIVEIRIQELRDAIDVFVISERNHSTHAATLLSQLSQGWISDYADHILYVPNYVKEQSDLDLLTHQITHHLSDVRPDDFVIFTSSDEIPTNPVLICLKLYDGFPDHFTFYFQQFLYGFYNPLKNSSNSTQSSFVSTINFFLRYCNKLGSCPSSKTIPLVIGSPKYPAGWNCKECANSRHYQTNNFSKPVDMFVPNYVLARQPRFRYLVQPRQRKLHNSATRNFTTQTNYIPVS